MPLRFGRILNLRSSTTYIQKGSQIKLSPKGTPHLAQVHAIRDKLTRAPSRKLLWDTLVGHSASQKRAFRTRLPPKVTREVSKTSVSYKTSSKSHMSSPQNERFVRDFLKNSHVKVCKTNVSHETSSKSPAETPIGAHTSRSPAKQFRDSSPSKRHPLKRQSQCDSDIHLYHNSQPPDSLHRPRIFPRPHV